MIKFDEEDAVLLKICSIIAICVTLIILFTITSCTIENCHKNHLTFQNGYEQKMVESDKWGTAIIWVKSKPQIASATQKISSSTEDILLPLPPEKPDAIMFK